MAFFKHNKSGKCLSLGESGAFISNSSLLLEDCPQNLAIEAGNHTNYFRIKYKDTCFVPSQNGDKVVFGPCNDEMSSFSKYNMEKTTGKYAKKNSLNVYFLLNSNFIGDSKLFSKQVINVANDGMLIDFEKYDVFYKLTNIRYRLGRRVINVSNHDHISKLIQNGNLEFETNMSLHYADKDTGKELNNMPPMYFKAVRGSNGLPNAIVFTKEKPQQELLFIMYKSPVSKSRGIVNKNDMTVRWSVYIDKQYYQCKFDSNFKTGLRLMQGKKDVTTFYMIIKDNDEKFKFLESARGNKTELNIRSFQNPSMMLRKSGNDVKTAQYKTHNAKNFDNKHFAKFSQPIIEREGFSSQNIGNRNANQLETAKSLVDRVNESGVTRSNLRALSRNLGNMNNNMTAKVYHKDMYDLLDNGRKVIHLELDLENQIKSYQNLHNKMEGMLISKDGKLESLTEKHRKPINDLRKQLFRAQDRFNRKTNRLNNVKRIQFEDGGQVKFNVSKLNTIPQIDRIKKRFSSIENYIRKYNTLYKIVVEAQRYSIFEMGPNSNYEFMMRGLSNLPISEIEKELAYLNRQNLPNERFHNTCISVLTQVKNNKLYFELAKLSNNYKYPTSSTSGQNALNQVIANMSTYLSTLQNYIGKTFDVDNYFENGMCQTGYKKLYEILNDSNSIVSVKMIAMYQHIVDNARFDNLKNNDKNEPISSINKILVKFNNIHNKKSGSMFNGNDVVRQAYAYAMDINRIESTNSSKQGFTSGIQKYLGLGSTYEGMSPGRPWFDQMYRVTNTESTLKDALQSAFIYPSSVKYTGDALNKYTIDAGFQCNTHTVSVGTSQGLDALKDNIEDNCINNGYYDSGKLTLVDDDDVNGKLLLRRTISLQGGGDSVTNYNLSIPNTGYGDAFDGSKGEYTYTEIGFDHTSNPKTFTLMKPGESLVSTPGKVFKLVLTESGSLQVYQKTATTVQAVPGGGSSGFTVDISAGLGTDGGSNKIVQVYREADSTYYRRFVNRRNKLYYVDNKGQLFPHKRSDIVRKDSSFNYVDQSYNSGGDAIIAKSSELSSLSSPFSNIDDAKTACNTDENCIGIYAHDASTFYNVQNSEFKKLQLGSGVSGPIFKMKMFESKPSSFNKSFPNNTTKSFPTLTQIPYENRGNKVPKSGGFKVVLGRIANDYKAKRADFQNKFNTFVNAFESLSENELKMLERTNVNIKNLKKMIDSYDELYNKANNNAKMKELVNAHTRDTQISHGTSEYSMALAGLLSIGSMMYLFTKIK